MLTRKTIFITQSTVGVGGGAVRLGGWSESFWQAGPFYNPFGGGGNLPFYRAALLPNGASLVGARDQSYTILGNKLIPGGSAIYRGLVNGSSGLLCDVPQVGLQVGGSVVGGNNAARLILRGIPDSQTVSGEYNPSLAYATAVQKYLTYIQTSVAFGMIGRDLSQVAQRVNNIAGAVLTTSAVIAGVVNNASYIRFLHVKDDSNLPVTGTYLVTAGAGTAALTLQGLNKTLTKPNGLARVDAISFYAFGALFPVRAIVRKVGRPFVQYRGRASKRRRAS